jgi:hypothetical protein
MSTKYTFIIKYAIFSTDGENLLDVLNVHIYI